MKYLTIYCDRSPDHSVNFVLHLFGPLRKPWLGGKICVYPQILIIFLLHKFFVPNSIQVCKKITQLEEKDRTSFRLISYPSHLLCNLTHRLNVYHFYRFIPSLCSTIPQQLLSVMCNFMNSHHAFFPYNLHNNVNLLTILF